MSVWSCRPSPRRRRPLRSVLPPQMSVANPVDTALFTDEKGYSLCAETVLHDPAIGTLLLVLTRLAHDYQALLPWLERLSGEARAMGKRLAVSYLSSSDTLSAHRTAAGWWVPAAWCLPTAERVVGAIGRRAMAARAAAGR
jgi:acyl-CoA synthetase (NDP forming)